MDWHWYFSAFALAGGACLAVYAFYAWQHRRASAGASPAIVPAAGWWSLTYALELAATQLSTKLLWGDAKWLGICLLPPAWFAFIMQYTGRARWVNRSTMTILTVAPAAVIVLLANPATHDLVRYYPPSAAADPADAIAQVGPLFWPFLVYANLVVGQHGTLCVDAHPGVATVLAAEPAPHRHRAAAACRQRPAQPQRQALRPR